MSSIPPYNEVLIKCRCPICEEFHTQLMCWIGNGDVPKINCLKCIKMLRKRDWRTSDPYTRRDTFTGTTDGRIYNSDPLEPYEEIYNK